MKRILPMALALLLPLAAARAWAEDETPNADRMRKAAGSVTEYSRLKMKNTTAVEFVHDKDRMMEIMRDFFRRDYPGDKFQALNSVLYKFGFGLFDDKSEDDIIRDITRGMLGVYDDETKNIYIVGFDLYKQLTLERYDECNIKRAFMSPGTEEFYKRNMEEIVLVHETTHALEDQQFDLFDIRRKFEHNDDAYFAAKTAIEGLAESVEEEYVSRVFGGYYESMYGMTWELKDFSLLDEAVEKSTDSSGESLCKDRDITFLGWRGMIPYLFGNLHMYKVKSEQGANKTGDLFRKRCLLSSEQVMASDKFYNPDREDLPTFINLPSFDDALDTSEWRYLDYNSLGQLTIYLLCRDLFFDPVGVCLPAATGWGGDRYIVWRNQDDEPLVVWYTTWDTKDDATEFYSFYNRAYQQKKVGEGDKQSGSAWQRVLADEESMYMEQRDKDVIIIEGPLDKDGFDKVSELLWTAAKYKTDYGVCAMSASEFHDYYPGAGGAPAGDVKESASSESPVSDKTESETTGDENPAEDSSAEDTTSDAASK